MTANTKQNSEAPIQSRDQFAKSYKEARAMLHAQHRDHNPIQFKKKHIKQYEHEFELLTHADPSMRVLEIGCGKGQFLKFLDHKNYRRTVGIDFDKQLAPLLDQISSAEIFFDNVLQLINSGQLTGPFDRIVMFDVAEHIEFDELVTLLKTLQNLLSDNGNILMRVPNVTSPWGLDIFFSSFDHITPLSPGRLNQLAAITGYHCLGIYPQPIIPLGRRIKSWVLNKTLDFLLASPPDIWTANCLAVYTLKKI